MSKKVVLALSGGMDSTVLLYMAAKQFDEVYTLTFDYGQRHIKEVASMMYHVHHVENNLYPNKKIVQRLIDTRFISDIAPVSSLTNKNIDNPNIKEMAGDAQPVSYVPFRNLMFLTISCSYAEALKADTVWYGAALADSLAGYWDGSAEFLDSVNKTISLNRKSKINIEAPLIKMSKKDIILEGRKLNVDFSNTWTCYSNRDDGLADATTPSSSLRLKGFIEAKLKDPIKYVQQEAIDKIYAENNCVDF